MPTTFLAREALLLVQAMPSLARTRRKNSTFFTDTFFYETLIFWLTESRGQKILDNPEKVKGLIQIAIKDTTEEDELVALTSILSIGVEKFWPGRQPSKI